MTTSKKRIGELLIDAGLISKAQLAEALKVQEEKGGRVVNALVMLGHLTPIQFVKFLAKQPGVAGIELGNCGVPREIIALVPREFALAHEIFPIDKLGKLLTVGMVCPLDSGTVEQLEKVTGLRVKPLLCSPEDVRAAITKYYPGEEYTHIPKGLAAKKRDATPAAVTASAIEDVASTLRLGSVVTLIRQINSLPALPETVQKTRDAMSNPSVSIISISKVIATDPPVAARILSVANSALYGFAHRVNSLDLAISLMGLRETYSIVLSMSVINMMEASKKSSYKKFWQSSLFAADAANSLYTAYAAKGGTALSRGGVFAACLLQDIGRLALMEVTPKLYATISPSASGLELLTEEEKVVGVSHAEAGYELALHWDLPSEIGASIRFHHHPDRASAEAKELVAYVCLSDAMIRCQEGQGDAAFNGLDGPLATLKLTIDEIKKCQDDFAANRGKMAAALGET
jgi:HD-like signal output (HDOD) protein